jgi:hypothetical protein
MKNHTKNILTIMTIFLHKFLHLLIYVCKNDEYANVIIDDERSIGNLKIHHQNNHKNMEALNLRHFSNLTPNDNSFYKCVEI